MNLSMSVIGFLTLILGFMLATAVSAFRLNRRLDAGFSAKAA